MIKSLKYVLVLNLSWAFLSFLLGNSFSILTGFLIYLSTAIFQIFYLIKFRKNFREKVYQIYLVGLFLSISLIFLNFQINYLGNKYAPTFGCNIGFNEFLWNHPLHSNLNHFMAYDLKNKLENEKQTPLEIKKMLGEPFSEKSNELEYFLRSDSFIIGIAYESLLITFKDGKVDSVYICHAD